MTARGFWRLAEEDPSWIALVTPDGHEVAAGTLLAAANRAVHGLRALGLGPGDTIALVMPNRPETLALYLAAHQAGWYVTPINHHFTTGEIAYIVNDSGAAAMVVDGECTEASRGLANAVRISERRRFAMGGLPGFRPYDELVDGQSDGLPDDRRAGATMNYTSGTTGRPKGVRRPLPPVDPETLVAASKGIFSFAGVTPGGDDVHLSCSPLYHTIASYTLTSLHYGHRVVLRSRFDPADALACIERHGVTTTHMVPTMFHRLLALPDDLKAATDVSSLRHVLHAAAPCPPAVKQAMLDWWGPVLYEYYGATEGGGAIASPEEWLKRPGTVGKAWEGADIRVLDDDGNDLPPDTPGTIWMLVGANRFQYFNDEAKTSASRREGFFTVGDIGYLDEDGYLFLCDRKADLIISGGVNIYPAEIEGVLLSHPAVGDAAVFGIPDDEWGEQVHAVIEPAPDAVPGSALADELLSFCRGQLAAFKVPRQVEFTTALPRDPSGKLYKRTLREPYWAGRSRTI